MSGGPAAPGGAVGDRTPAADPGGAPHTRGIQGHLRLVCAPDAGGRSILREQSFRAPIHLSKPHWDAETLVLNIVNPTAGLLDGDRILQEARVETGGRLLLTCPSASRAHRMRFGFAGVEQRFQVARGGFLEVNPEMFIPQAGARYRQTTLLEVEPGGELLFFESLAPGRVASGEAFLYEWLDWRTDLRVGGKLAARERYHLERESAALEGLRRQFPEAYYGSVLLVSPRLTPESGVWRKLHELQSGALWIGASPLGVEGCWNIKLAAGDAISLRSAIHAARGLAYGELGWNAPDWRRVAGR